MRNSDSTSSPESWYAAAITTFGVLAASSWIAARRSGATRRDAGPLTATEVLIQGLAAHKVSRLLTRSKVATPLRSPFTRNVGPGAPSEVEVEPIGDGPRRMIGELVACPFCLDVWVGGALVAGRLLAPAPTRAIVSLFGSVAVADLLHYASAIAVDHAEAA